MSRKQEFTSACVNVRWQVSPVILHVSSNKLDLHEHTNKDDSQVQLTTFVLTCWTYLPLISVWHVTLSAALQWTQEYHSFTTECDHIIPTIFLSFPDCLVVLLFFFYLFLSPNFFHVIFLLLPNLDLKDLCFKGWNHGSSWLKEKGTLGTTSDVATQQWPRYSKVGKSVCSCESEQAMIRGFSSAGDIQKLCTDLWP